VAELALDVLADLDVLEQLVGELPLVEPIGLPVVDGPDAETLRMNLLPHQIRVIRACVVVGSII
jgi:hypothetical protein